MKCPFCGSSMKMTKRNVYIPGSRETFTPRFCNRKGDFHRSVRGASAILMKASVYKPYYGYRCARIKEQYSCENCCYYASNPISAVKTYIIYHRIWNRKS